MLGIQDNMFFAVSVNFYYVDAIVVRPTMFDFAFASGHVQILNGKNNISRFESDGVYAINRHMAMHVVGISVDGYDTLMLG